MAAPAKKVSFSQRIQLNMQAGEDPSMAEFVSWLNDASQIGALRGLVMDLLYKRFLIDTGRVVAPETVTVQKFARVNGEHSEAVQVLPVPPARLGSASTVEEPQSPEPEPRVADQVMSEAGQEPPGDDSPSSNVHQEADALPKSPLATLRVM
ncbi:hypothetical protein [Pseudomonas aeruginosa]|uniref:hypothetical protein n=1 Tax=Pseudomonas aeruginosa TaxID=287 RepID=UPI0032B34783